MLSCRIFHSQRESTQWDFPCCIGLPLAYMPSPLPRRKRQVHASLASPSMTVFPRLAAGRLPHQIFRGLLGVHSRWACTLAKSPQVTLCTEGFSRFVTSATASIASGWSDSCRVGFAPTGRPCLRTAHATANSSRPARPRAARPAIKSVRIHQLLSRSVTASPARQRRLSKGSADGCKKRWRS